MKVSTEDDLRRQSQRLCRLYCPGVPACFRQSLIDDYHMSCTCTVRSMSVSLPIMNDVTSDVYTHR